MFHHLNAQLFVGLTYRNKVCLVEPDRKTESLAVRDLLSEATHDVDHALYMHQVAIVSPVRAVVVSQDAPPTACFLLRYLNPILKFHPV